LQKEPLRSAYSTLNEKKISESRKVCIDPEPENPKGGKKGAVSEEEQKKNIPQTAR